MRKSTKKQAKEALELSEKIQPLLRGHDPSVQGSVLIDLVSIYIAGHHPDMRKPVLEAWISTMIDMIEPSVKELFGEKGWIE